MAKKKKVELEGKKREENVFPFLSMSIDERLRLSKSINLKNNYSITDLGSGYWKIQPIDKEKGK